MTTYRAVIGANFGDEGKGLMTDYFADRQLQKGLTPSQIRVVRHNGGAQAGHTVQTPGGLRCVFSHLGSASLLGVPTVFSSTFLVNPVLFWREYFTYAARVGQTPPPPEVSYQCAVTTPYDMLLNQWIEQARGNGRHGSVGVGIYETVRRTAHIPLYYGDLAITGILRNQLSLIRTNYVPQRIRKVRLRLSPEQEGLLQSEELLENFVEDATRMASSFAPTSPQDRLRNNALVLFEGAQGLGLDQQHGTPPHATPSNTGPQNVWNILDALRAPAPDDRFLTFVTRAYLTRHGAGPLPNELAGPPYPGIVDATNQPNEFQGTMRFAYLDLTALRQRIDTYKPMLVKSYPSLAITCLDQVPEVMHWYEGDRLWEGTQTAFLDAVQRLFPGFSLYTSHGPTRQSVKLFYDALAAKRSTAQRAAAVAD